MSAFVVLLAPPVFVIVCGVRCLFLLFCPCALPCDLSSCLISECAWGVVFSVTLTAVLKRVCEPKDAWCVVASHICLLLLLCACFPLSSCLVPGIGLCCCDHVCTCPLRHDACACLVHCGPFFLYPLPVLACFVGYSATWRLLARDC